MLHLSFSFEYEDGGNFRMELHMTASSSRISPCPSPADPGSAAVVAHAAVPSSGAGIVPSYQDYDKDFFDLFESHGYVSRGAYVLLSLANISSPFVSNSTRVQSADYLILHAQLCIGVGCES